VKAVPSVITSYRITIMLDVFHIAHLMPVYIHFQLCVYFIFYVAVLLRGHHLPALPCVCVCVCVCVCMRTHG
jgi:hypothetical protein